jgi:DNA-binding NarL/FixJ family response regulator
VSRIIWIEDEGKVALVRYKTPLVRAGHTVDTASDASEAIQLMKCGTYDLYIFDVIIPAGPGFTTVMDPYVGFDLLQRLLAGSISGIAPLDPTTVLVFTVVRDRDLLQQLEDLHLGGIYQKTVADVGALKTAVDAILNPEQEDAGGSPHH